MVWPLCKCLLMPKKVGAKAVFHCSCGVTAGAEGTVLKEAGKKAETIAVIEKEVQAMPVVDEKCPKCKHGKAYHWEVQTRSADEPATRFYKCVQCACTWRGYK